jgi:hypothetical protein
MILKQLATRSHEWNEALKQIPSNNKDINYTPQWYDSWIEHEKAEPVCLYMEHEGYHILYPFFLNRISDCDLKQEYFDVQSAYGYGGAIASSDDLPAYIKSGFNRLVDEWMHDNNVIAEFIRGNPLIQSFKRDAEYSVVRQNVYIVTDTDYRIPDKQARQNVNKAKSSGLTIHYDKGLAYIQEFAALYQRTAKRLNMQPYYNFEITYFNNISNLLKEYTTLINIFQDDKLVAGGLYFKYDERATLHLVGSDENYLHMRVNDMLYHAAIQLSINSGAKILNVGGGTSNDPNDTLYRFKSKYSSNHKPVEVGKKILNKEVFERITHSWEQKYPDLAKKYGNYFLKYRIPTERVQMQS